MSQLASIFWQSFHHGNNDEILINTIIMRLNTTRLIVDLIIYRWQRIADLNHANAIIIITMFNYSRLLIDLL